MENEKLVPQMQVRTELRSGESQEVGYLPGGGYVNGVWYPDRSGVCGGVVPPQPPVPPYPPVPPSPPLGGGGYVNGIWYADRSGVCG